MDTLDHIGYAVTSLEDSIEFYRKTFGYQLELREEIKSQQVELAFLKLQNTKIELLMPTAPESKLQKFLDQRGPGLHHVCYRVSDIRKSLKELEQKGIRLIDREPRPGAHNTMIAFLHPKDTQGVLTELCEYPADIRGEG